jgi:hypothetical protein
LLELLYTEQQRKLKFGSHKKQKQKKKQKKQTARGSYVTPGVLLI